MAIAKQVGHLGNDSLQLCHVVPSVNYLVSDNSLQECLNVVFYYEII